MSDIIEQNNFLTEILRNDESKFEKEEENDDNLEDDEDQLELNRLRMRERNIGALTGAD